MVALLVGLMVAAAIPRSTKLTVICEVGRIAMRDLSNVDGNKGFDACYAAPDPNGRDLLTICPKLMADIPKDYPIADDDARSRAAVHAFIPGRHVREAFIYSVRFQRLAGTLEAPVFVSPIRAPDCAAGRAGCRSSSSGPRCRPTRSLVRCWTVDARAQPAMRGGMMVMGARRCG